MAMISRALSILLFTTSLAFAGQVGGISAPDPYTFTVNSNSPGSNAYVLGKTPKSSVVSGSWPIIVIMGQSLAASNATGSYSTVSANSWMFNVNDGANYACANPVLGGSLVTNLGSNGPSCIIADLLISNAVFPGVVIVNIAQDGSSSADWTNVNTLYQLIEATWKRLASKGLTPTYILWHNGEQDNILGTSAATITANTQAVAIHWRTLGFTGNFIVALESIVSNTPSATVRTGQANAVNSGLCIVQGADWDTMTGTDRQADGTHLSQAGNAAGAALDVSIITSLHSSPHC